MNILILEDNACRVTQFRQNLIGQDVFVVDTAEAAINLLKEKSWDMLFLDNDLGGEVYVPLEEENSGSGVARWLANNVDKQPEFIVVHSLNTVAQAYIHALLPSSQVVPFAWSKLKETVNAHETRETRE